MNRRNFLKKAGCCLGVSTGVFGSVKLLTNTNEAIVLDLSTQPGKTEVILNEQLNSGMYYSPHVPFRFFDVSVAEKGGLQPNKPISDRYRYYVSEV